MTAARSVPNEMQIFPLFEAVSRKEQEEVEEEEEEGEEGDYLN